MIDVYEKNENLRTLLGIEEGFTELNLAKKEVDFSQAMVLAKELQTGRATISLTLLGIGANPIGADGANALLETVKLSTTLKALDIGKPLPLQENFDSDALDLSQTDMGPGQVVILSWWLTTSFSTSLTKVAITDNKLSESDVAILRAAAPNGCEVVW